MPVKSQSRVSITPCALPKYNSADKSTTDQNLVKLRTRYRGRFLLLPSYLFFILE